MSRTFMSFPGERVNCRVRPYSWRAYLGELQMSRDPNYAIAPEQLGVGCSGFQGVLNTKPSFSIFFTLHTTYSVPDKIGA